MEKLQNWGVQDRQLTPAERWTSLAVVILVAALAAFNMFKVSPAIQFIAADLDMPKTMISQIMGSYSIPALVFAYVGMWLGQKTGFKFSAVISVVIMLVGTFTCLFMTTTTSFLAGRAIEGIGYGIIAVIGPNLVPRIFPRKNLGLSMGIWSQWIPFGTIASMVFAPLLFGLGGGSGVAFSWHIIFIVAMVAEAITLVLVLALFKMPKVNENTIVDGSTEIKRVKGRDFMAGTIIVCVAFIVYAYYNVVAVNTMYPTFLQNAKGMDVTASSWFTTIAALIGCVFGIAIGPIADRRRCRKAVLVVGYALAAVCAPLLWTGGSDLVGPVIGIILWGIVVGGVPTCTRAYIPQLVVDPKRTDFALSTMGFLMALGKVLGGYFVSPSIAAWGYGGTALYTLVPMSIVAAVIVLVFVKSDRSIAKLREQEAQQARDLAAGRTPRDIPDERDAETGSPAPVAS